MTQKDVRKQLPNLRCKVDLSMSSSGRVETCIAIKQSYATAPTSIGVSILDGEVVLIQTTGLSSQHFLRVKAGLIQALGEPNEAKTETLTNRMGASFQSERLQWSDADGQTLALTQLDGSISQSTVRLLGSDSAAKLADLGREAQRDAAKDL